jgi:hypothetical protein
LRHARRLVRCSWLGEANIFVPIFPLLIITSTPVGTAALIGTFWFLSAWSSYFDLSEREHSPYLGSENDDEEGRVSLCLHLFKGRPGECLPEFPPINSMG